jgi:hypothetical protein
MINTQLESLVELALFAFDATSIDLYERNIFELEFRKQLMKKYCNGGVSNTNTSYTIKPANVDGKWTTRSCPPATSTGTILHG